MTAREMAALIDRTGFIDVEDFTIEVMIRDVRQSFGNTELQVEPVNGRGIKWVRDYRVSLVA